MNIQFHLENVDIVLKSRYNYHFMLKKCPIEKWNSMTALDVNIYFQDPLFEHTSSGKSEHSSKRANV